MKISILILPIIALGFVGCTHTNKPNLSQSTLPKRIYQAPTPVKAPLFKTKMIAVAKSTLRDSRYHKMALDTPAKKAWFRNLMYRLWDRQMTRSEFISEGLKKYPTHGYEFRFIAYGFQVRS